MKHIQYGYESHKGRVNHIAILYHSEDWGTRWVLEALPKGVMCRPDRNRKWTHIVTPKYPAVHLVQKAEEFVHQKYDFKRFFLFALIILAWRWLKLKIKNPRLSGKSQICSEIAARTLPAALYIELGDPQWVHPEQLLKIQENHPELFTVKKMDRKA